MKSIVKTSLFILLFISICACNQRAELLSSKEESSKKVEMVTNYGTMVIELYNETPLHRDNFVNLVKHSAYDSLLFHRVINKFMIQGGDPDSKKAKPNDTLGDGDVPYVVKAEFNNELFHKKGTLAAARDNNPKKSSSGIQFYIVQGRVYNDSLLNRSENRISSRFAQEFYKDNSSMKPILDSINDAQDKGNRETYNLLSERILKLANADSTFKKYTIPDSQREIYKTLGGTPWLDQSYTVFGEVVKGMEVLDSIANVQTAPTDRPIADVRIKTVRLLD